MLTFNTASEDFILFYLFTFLLSDVFIFSLSEEAVVCLIWWGHMGRHFGSTGHNSLPVLLSQPLLLDAKPRDEACYL